MTGEQLYKLYYFEFNCIFAPKWNELDEYTKQNWNNLVEVITERIKNETKSS